MNSQTTENNASRYDYAGRDTHITEADYRMALATAHAGNLTAHIRLLNDITHRLMREARERGAYSCIDWVNHHPICILIVDQISTIAHGGSALSFKEYESAATFCQQKVGEQ